EDAEPANASTVDRIMHHIKDDLKRGRLAPGQRLIESELQQAVVASRDSVREDLRKLAADGLIEIHLHKGARVRRLLRTEVESLYDIREVLEGLAARLAAQHMRAPAFRKQVAAIEAAYDRADDGSARAYMGYNEAFHRAILDLSARTSCSICCTTWR
ncbi:unnamed protein product, partial [Phaeothamnion confervicola]